MKTLILSFILLSAGLNAVMAGDSLKVGQSLPKLSTLITDAAIPATAGKVVLVDFWASWCVPCKASFPVLNALHQKYASKGLVIVGVGVDEDAAEYKKFASKLGVTFPIVHDSAHKAAAAFGPSTMPTSYIIDRKGVVRHVHAGFKGAKTEAEYISEIEALLAETK